MPKAITTKDILLKTNRLVISELSLEDLDDHHRLLSHPKAMYYLDDIKTTTLDESRANLLAALSDIGNLLRRFYFLKITTADGEFVGEIGYTVTHFTHQGKIVNLGYFTLPEFWGRGYVTEAAREVMRFAFCENDVLKIETGCNMDNKASENIMIKLGMRKEAEQMLHSFCHGKICSGVRYGMTKEDYLKRRELDEEVVIQPFRESYLHQVMELQEEIAAESIIYGFGCDSAKDILTVDSCFFFLAFVKGKLAGCVCGEVMENNRLNVFPGGVSYLQINDLLVRKAYRSRGIGTLLLKAMEEAAYDKGLKNIFVSSASKNCDGARRFYTENGYGVWTTIYAKRSGSQVAILPLNSLGVYKYCVIFARYQNKWLYARHKERATYESPGGHIEKGETPIQAAKRELYEETGATQFDIYPVADYTVYSPTDYGNSQLYFANIHTLGNIPESEMAEVRLFETIPDNMTYPDILPVLYGKINEFIRENPSLDLTV